MPTQVDRATVTAAQKLLFAEFRTAVAGLDDIDWKRETPCPGWNVQALVAHVIGTERMLLGEQPPAPTSDPKEREHVHNDIGAYNEMWIDAMAGDAPAQMLAHLDEVIARRTAMLDTMTDEAWDEVGFTPAGPDTHGRFVRVRIFDIWLHEQDLRDAVGLDERVDGIDAAAALDEFQSAMGFVVGKKAGATDGQSVRIALTGLQGRDIDVAVIDGRAKVVDTIDGEPTATVTTDVGTFVRTAGGRTSAPARRDQISTSGDLDLATRVVDHLAYTI